MNSLDAKSAVESTADKQKRLPRFRRAQKQENFILTRRDLDIMRNVESFRLLTSKHIQALSTGSDQGILRRLQKLYHAGYLDRITPPRTYGEGSQKMIYAITNKGFRVLQETGIIKG